MRGVCFSELRLCFYREKCESLLLTSGLVPCWENVLLMLHSKSLWKFGAYCRWVVFVQFVLMTFGRVDTIITVVNLPVCLEQSIKWCIYYSFLCFLFLWHLMQRWEWCMYFAGVKGHWPLCGQYALALERFLPFILKSTWLFLIALRPRLYGTGCVVFSPSNYSFPSVLVRSKGPMLSVCVVSSFFSLGAGF